jgi:transcriptional regulator with XRE-family HTH domain
MRDSSQQDEAQSPSSAEANSQEWQGLPARINQLLTLAGLSQTDLARQLGLSSGFVSEVARGLKHPGPDFFIGVRKLLGVSIDWLMTGEGTMTGGAGIRQDLFQAIRLQVAVAKAAVTEGDPLAKALMILIREGNLNAAGSDKAFSELLDRIAPADADLDLAVQLYNGHLWTGDPITQRRNLLAAAVAHFEARKPLDKLAAITGTNPYQPSPAVQVNFGHGNRIAGRDFIEKSGSRRTKK